MKSAVMVRSVSITTLMEILPASLSPISPDHFSKLHPSEGTAVTITIAPLAYVAAEHSGGSYVMVPPFSGVLTTVSFFSPQAQSGVGTAEDSRNAAQAAMTATSQSSLRFRPNVIPLFTSRDGRYLCPFIILHPGVPVYQLFKSYELLPPPPHTPWRRQPVNCIPRCLRLCP